MKPIEITDNPFKLIGSDNMLITAGKKKLFNTMTAAWGGLGHLWNKDVAYIFIRPTRYTYQFTEKNDYFTLCFFEEKYREILNYCGSKSGRDTDKIKGTGLIPIETQNKNIYFKQARLVLECKKLYYDDIKPGQMTDKEIDKLYPLKDYHRLYIGEIINIINYEL